MKKLILIVDDSVTVRQQLVFTLNKDGFEAVEASDGLEGIEKYKEHADDIALLISDVNMPNLSGLDMVEKMKNQGILKAPFIMLTTESKDEMIQRAKSAGAVGWLTKPFEPQVLISVIKKITGS